MQVVPYFECEGNAKEAIELYTKVFNAKTTFTMLYKDNEDILKENPDYGDKILHATLEVGKGYLYIADASPGNKITHGNNVFINVDFDALEALEKSFKLLSQGGEVLMELEDTFWGSRYGTLIDKFGNGWSLYYNYPEK